MMPWVDFVHSLPRKALSIVFLPWGHPMLPLRLCFRPLSTAFICYSDESPTNHSTGRKGKGGNGGERDGGSLNELTGGGSFLGLCLSSGLWVFLQIVCKLFGMVTRAWEYKRFYEDSTYAKSCPTL